MRPWFPLMMVAVVGLLTHQCVGLGPDEVVDVIELSLKIGQQIFQAWGVISKELHQNQSDMKLFPFEKRENKVIQYIQEVSRKLEVLTRDLQRGDDVEALVRQLPTKNRLELRLNDLADLVARVNVAHDQMRYYVNNTDHYERETLEDFARSVITHDVGGMPLLLARIHLMIAPSGHGVLDRGVLELLRDTTEEANSDLCSLHQSPQQLLYNLYNTITLTELKGYAMMQFSYMLLRVFEKGNYTQEAASMRERYEDRSIQTIAAVKRAMTGASRQLWVCDPKTHVEGETFVRLTRLLQGYIENEVDMNSEQSCSENCAAYSYTTNYGCYKDQFCAKQTRCNGKIIKCQYIDSDMWVCPARERSGRRYEYIEYENGRILGHKQTCISGTSKVDSWWRWIFWHCSYCMCFCDEQGINSDRYFNMRDVVAWVEKNRVVTGLRFVKVNRIIHLQIQQGELLPRANIDPATLEWLPVDDYNLLDANVRNGVDYHTLTWDNRGIDLDDLLVPNNHVLTGVRFRKVGGHLNFEIQYCEFNFTTGKLINPKNRFYWLSNDNTDGSFLNPRLQLTLQTPDVPTRSHVPSAPDSQTNQFIEFTHSDLDRDAAQTTVPYLDAQSVTPEFVVPLMGAGIYHKGQLGSGGYVAPKVFTYDYSRHMKSLFPIK